MKLMIASDLHGSAAYTRRLLLELYRDTGASGWCCWETCCTTAHETRCRRGYEPPAVAKRSTTWRMNCCASGATATPRWTRWFSTSPILSDSALLVLDGLTIHATHGHIHGPDTPPPLRQGRYPAVRTLPCAGAPGLRPLHLSESRLRSPCPRRTAPTAA